jgi:hypothetical protein
MIPRRLAYTPAISTPPAYSTLGPVVLMPSPPLVDVESTRPYLDLLLYVRGSC